MYFFVTGLARSRTAWIANFLTSGKTICLHDALIGCGSVEELRDKMAAQPFPNVGNSDSGLALIWPKLLQQFPDAKTVFVWRDPNEAYWSYIEYFTRHPYGGQRSLLGLRTWFDMLEEELKVWRTKATNAIDVDFKALESAEECLSIWKFISDEPFNRARWELLHNLRVNPASEKITLSPEKVKQLWLT